MDLNTCCFMSQLKTILVVEDDRMLREALQKKLTLSTFEVVACALGEEAVAHLTKTIKLPDAICLDYYLPDMTGADFIRLLQAHDSWAHIPVLMLSNTDEEKSITSTLSQGAKLYMLKTQYTLEDVVNQLRKYCE